MYEHRSEPLLPANRFYRRFFSHFLISFAVIVLSLGIGIAGYHFTEGFSFIDSLLNASMILGGMGPVDTLQTTGGKLFASFYSLFSGIVFLASAGILIAPVAHRIMHRLHISSEERK